MLKLLKLCVVTDGRFASVPLDLWRVFSGLANQTKSIWRMKMSILSRFFFFFSLSLSLFQPSNHAQKGGWIDVLDVLDVCRFQPLKQQARQALNVEVSEKVPEPKSPEISGVSAILADRI